MGPGKPGPFLFLAAIAESHCIRTLQAHRPEVFEEGNFSSHLRRVAAPALIPQVSDLGSARINPLIHNPLMRQIMRHESSLAIHHPAFAILHFLRATFRPMQHAT